MTAGYEPPTIGGDEPARELVLADGVLGVAVEDGGRIHIQAIRAAREGAGDVGRFLDALSPRCVVWSVASPRLRGMLERRAWCAVSDLHNDGTSAHAFVHRDFAPHATGAS